MYTFACWPEMNSQRTVTELANVVLRISRNIKHNFCEVLGYYKNMLYIKYKTSFPFE